MKSVSETGLLQGVFDSIPNPIFVLDPMKYFILANQAFYDLLNTPGRDVTGMNAAQILPPDLLPLFSGKPGAANNTEIRFRKSDGTTNPYLVSVLTARFGKRTLEVITFKDLAENKLAEESLQESESRYRTLVNQLPNPIVIHVDRKVVFANDLIVQITGLTHENILGRDVADLLTDPFDQGNNAVLRNLAGNSFVEEEEFEVRTANRKMVIKNFLLRNSKIKYLGKEAVMTILIDITERKHLEKYVLNRVIETEEKDRRQFAADLHDDLGPTLSSIKLHLGLLEHSKNPEKSAETLAICNRQISDAIAKMRIIANNLMPRLIDNFGLESAIQAFINTMQHEGVFTIVFKSNLKGRRFQKQTELHFYRILCELINNTVKHAGASLATIRLKLLKEALTLSYTDNGKGYVVSEIDKKPGSLGIGNIIQRVNLMDAKIRFVNRKNRTEVIISKEI
jgi:PAS domain S-box-containing protein